MIALKFNQSKSLANYETNKPPFGSVFCPCFGIKGAFARRASCCEGSMACRSEQTLAVVIDTGCRFRQRAPLTARDDYL